MEVAHQEWRESNVGTTLALLEGTRADLRGWEWRYVRSPLPFRPAHAQGAHRCSDLVGVVQPRRQAGRHRQSRRDGEGLGRPERRRGPHAQGAHRSGHFGVVQPRWLADRHRESGRDGEGLGRPERRRGPHAQGAHSSRLFGVVQPRRLAGRHRQLGRDSEGLGRPERRRGPHAQGAHRSGHVGDVQPRRLAGRHRQLGTRRRRSGTPGAAPRCSRSRGTPARVYSATFSPDGTRIVTGSWDKRRRSGTPGAAPRSSRSRDTPFTSFRRSFSPDGSRVVTASRDGTAKVWDARGSSRRVPHAQGAHSPRRVGVVQPRRLAGRHRQRGLDGEGLGRPGQRRGPHAQGSHRPRQVGVVQPRRLAGRHRRCGHDGEGLGRPERRRGPHAQGTHRQVFSATFSPDGSRIVTASQDRTAKVWDAKSGADDPHAQGARRSRHFGVVQPRRLADRHRQ